MSGVTVQNPTSKDKAVRVAGGHVVIKAGKSEAVTADWTDTEKAKYEKAGLVFKATSAPKSDAKSDK